MLSVGAGVLTVDDASVPELDESGEGVGGFTTVGSGLTEPSLGGVLGDEVSIEGVPESGVCVEGTSTGAGVPASGGVTGGVWTLEFPERSWSSCVLFKHVCPFASATHTCCVVIFWVKMFVIPFVALPNQLTKP